MNRISIHIESDGFNSEQAQALAVLAATLKPSTERRPYTAEPSPDCGTSEEQPAPEEKPKATRNRSKKADAPQEEKAAQMEVVQPETVEPENVPAEDEDDLMGDTATEAETAPAITIVEIRAKVSDKQAVHKEAIRAKLGELGAANVTALKESDYQTFYAFLNTLS